jgi:hypothetical protein
MVQSHSGAGRARLLSTGVEPEFAHEVEFIFSDHTRNPFIAEEVMYVTKPTSCRSQRITGT